MFLSEFYHEDNLCSRVLFFTLNLINFLSDHCVKKLSPKMHFFLDFLPLPLEGH